uniref:FTH domain-containing protein n=2 Tax=Caenorhabditis tropicalis TaxID=1561998 RepID=A0A1I7T2T7_9PELO
MMNMDGRDIDEDHPVFEAISERLLGNLEQYLKDRPRPLLVPEFYTSVFELDQVLKVLPNLARVNKISITNRKPGSWNIEELVKHEQWKNAEIIHIFDRNLVAEIRDFEGFEDVNLQFERMMVKEVMQWKEMITKSPKMKSGKINFKTSDAEAHFLRTHGPPSEDTDQFGDDRRNWFFRLPDEESVLQISFYKKWFRFARVELKEVTGIVIE